MKVGSSVKDHQISGGLRSRVMVRVRIVRGSNSRVIIVRVRGQRLNIRGSEVEVKGQLLRVRGQKSTFRSQGSEV